MSKKVLILSGSPRKRGNSDTLCYEFLFGTGVWQKGDIEGSQAMKEAYNMGENV